MCVQFRLLSLTQLLLCELKQNLFTTVMVSGSSLSNFVSHAAAVFHCGLPGLIQQQTVRHGDTFKMALLITFCVWTAFRGARLLSLMKPQEPR